MQKMSVALDELHHGTRKTMRYVPENHAKSRGGLALALAGVDDDQALLVGLRGHDLVARGLLLGHLAGVAFQVVGLVGVFSHGVVLSGEISETLAGH